MKNFLTDTWSALEKQERKRFIILALLDIIISVVDILSLALLLWIIKFYIQPTPTIVRFLPRWMATQDSISFIAIFFVLFGVKNAAAFFISRAQYKFNAAVAVRISRENLQRYQQGSFEDFVSIDSSVQIRRISLQPFEFCQYILSGIQQITTQSFLIILTIAAIILFNARLFLLLLVILLPPVVVVFYLLKRRLSAAKMHIRSSNERSFQYLLDALKGFVEANIYGRNDFFMNRFIRERRRFSRYLFDSLALQNMPGRIIEIFAVLGLFILIAIAKWSGNNNSGALITVGAFMAAAYKIIPGIVKIINVAGQMRAYEYAITDMVRGRNIISETVKPECIRSLELRNVHFKYGTLPVLNGISLRLEKGDLLGITGESGKGKTTILNLMLGFLAPDRGEISFNETQVGKQAIHRFWPFICYVRQQSFFIHDTALRNITFEEEQFDKAKVSAALNVSGAGDFLEKDPEGLKKMITENGKNISGGQQQRIALARAAYKDADLILLDEPFNELDEASATMILGHLKELAAKGKIVVVVTHDKKTLSYCNKIISLDQA